ncbi:MAG: glycosyltransferase family 2 protein [Bacteroidaceae bacterium]|nr:glycosyltransferase family 2 protein [Bacteroidaceae bacterium]
MTAVILINWNGAADTIDCLESLDRAEGEFFVVVADNGSTDNSVEVLAPLCENLKNHPIHLLKLDKNYGFAGGNNRAVKFAMKYNPESIMLLNNDTVVDSQFLLRLLDFSQKNVEYRVLSPCINYYYDKSLVWSCGGRQIFGSRKSYYRDVKYSDICNNAFLNISFVSGCALFCFPEILQNDGSLFTERFFFGEEDYEFSLRMREKKVKMACVTDSVIYHKVASSQKNTNDTYNIGRYYMYYLGRLISARLHYHNLQFQLIRVLTVLSSVSYFYRLSGSLKKAISIEKRLMKDSLVKDSIGYEEFQSLMIDKNYFE